MMSNLAERIAHIGVVAGTANVVGRPLLDSTRLLARAALRDRVQEERHSERKHLVDRRIVTRSPETVLFAEEDRLDDHRSVDDGNGLASTEAFHSVTWIKIE